MFQFLYFLDIMIHAVFRTIWIWCIIYATPIRKRSLISDNITPILAISLSDVCHIRGTELMNLSINTHEKEDDDVWRKKTRRHKVNTRCKMIVCEMDTKWIWCDEKHQRGVLLLTNIMKRNKKKRQQEQWWWWWLLRLFLLQINTTHGN